MRWLRSFFNLRIRLILLVLLALLPALGIMLYTAAETRQREAEQIEAEALTLAQVISADQESLIVGARQLLIALSQIRDVQSGDPALCSSRLVELLKLYPNYTGFGVAQPDGEVFCSTAPSAQPINASEQAWFQRSVESGDFSVGDYQVDRTTGRSILVFGYPVFNPADQLEKVIFAVIEPSILSQLATETSLPEGAVLTQVDRNGTIINRFPDPETWVGQTLPNAPLIQTILSRGEGVAQLAGLDGVSRLYAFTPLRSPLETGLYLSIGIPNQVAYARADQALRRNLIWLGLVGLLALLAAWFGGEAFILRRVKALVSATERVRQGDLGARTGLKYSRDELGYLARAFDDMATTLEQRETERQEAEETIREQRELLRVTLASIGDAVITTDTQARITFMNPVAETLSGWSQVEAREKPLAEVFKIINEHTRQTVENPALKSLREGVVVGLANHTLLIRKDGREVPIDDSSAPILDEPGNLRGAVLVFRDITERRRAQQALEAQRLFLRQVIDINPNFIFAKDREGRFTLVNQAVATAYGTTVQKLLGKTDADFNPNPAEVEHFRQDDLEVMNSLQEKFIPEEIITDAAGQVRWLQTVKRPLTSPDGRVDQILGVATDITERKRIEEALRLSRDQLTIILQGVADGITVQDKQGRLIYANDAAARLNGYPSAEAMLAAPLQEFIQKFRLLDEKGQPFPFDQLPGRLALQGELTPAATVRFQIIATGEERWSYVKARPIFDERGHVELAINIFQDITELKRSEQAQRFLAEASTLLASSLNYEITLASIANLAVPHMADWCAVDVLQEDETVQRLAVAHVDPTKVALAHELQRRYPPDWDAPTGVPNVLRTGQPEFYPEITDAMLEAGARDAEHLQLARELQLRSAMAVPLKAHGRIFGVLTFVWAESGHHYNAADLALAEELAHRAALAVDNARLYQEAQRLNTELEQRVIKRTTELQAANTKLEGEIAERKKVEEEFRGLLEAAPDAITIINPAGQIALINSQTEQLFGYTRHELLGQTIEVLMPLRFRDKHLIHRATYAKEARPRAMGIGLDLFGRHKDGREFPVEISLSPLQSEEGLLVISAIRDITWRKNMEVELDEIQHRLVESRERDRLQLGRELHDGPIQDLYGVAFGLEAFKETLDQVSLTQFRVVQSTLWQVISTLRFISSELRPQTLTPFGLEKAILSHVERFQEMHPELQVKLDLTPDGQTLPEGMRLTLFRIYQELLNNAAQHAQAGQVWIRYTLDSEHVVLEVKDDGRGFEAPQRWVELARQGQLGLVETQERVEAMGGQMKVDSKPGEGTLIRVVVPRPNPTE